MNVYKASAAFLQDPKSGVRSKATRTSYRSDLARLEQNRDVDSFTEHELLEIIFTPLVKGPRIGQRPSDGTLYSRRSCLESFFSYCHFRGWIKEDPSSHLKRHIPGKGKPVIQHNWLTHDEVEKVLSHVDMETLDGPRDNIFLRFGFTAGLRISELTSLRLKDVNFDRREISLVGKGEKIAVISISRNTFGYLVDWHGQAAAYLGRPPHDEVILPPKYSVSQGVDENHNFLPGRCEEILFDATQPVSKTTLTNICKRYSKASGIKFAPHDMRRTFAGLMFEKVDIYEVSKALRHTDVSTTQKYLQTRPDAAAQVVRAAGLDF